MKIKITTKAVDSLVIKPKVYEVCDEIQSGFVIRVLPSGLKSFWIRYRLSNGKRDRFVLGHYGIITVAQAREKAKSLLADVTMGKDPKAPKHVQENKILTLLEFIKEQYQSWCESHLQYPQKQLSKLYKFSDFLQTPLNEITPFKVEKWRSDCLKSGHAPSTVNRNLVVLRSVISKAVEWGIIEEHPLRSMRLLKVDRSPNVRYLTEDEENRLRNALDAREVKLRSERESGNAWRLERGYELLTDLSQQPFVDYLKPLVLLSLNTGARQGELFRLYWSDIDFDRRSLALVMRGKRKSHTRHIPLNKEAFQTLQAWRSIRPMTDKLVFSSKNGEKMDNVQTSWENVRKEARLENFRWHDMRHHFASRLVMNGVPLNTVRELLGHTNLEMTLRYAHLAPEQKEKAVAVLDR
ncbi:MAG: tyrosine-type recombinase/integrase [Candidatus Berkiella sp.]